MPLLPTQRPSESLDRALFRQPPARTGMAPFWFWNGAMSADMVRRQVRQMAEAGLGGFFIHPRQGLSLPYLSKAWFERVRVAVETARECGLEVWLYDEYPYPSGIAGGLVTANHPEFRARVLDKFEFAVQGSIRREFPLGRLVCALAYPIRNGEIQDDEALDIREEIGIVLTRDQFWLWPMGHIPYNEKRFMADEGRLVLEWTPPAGEWQLFIAIEREQSGFKYYDCFFDPLVPGAVEEFIRLTHERYADELDEFFGNTIPGIFTDETEPPFWSPHIEAALQGQFNSARDVPALWDDTNPAKRLLWRQTALDLFAQRWERPIAQWCREHNLIWGAEKPTWRPTQFGEVAQPSTDAGHRRIGMPPEPLPAELRANHRAAIAAAEQNGTEEVRCECFHSLGWGATLQDQKWSIDWLCTQGVNRFTPHAFYATSSGLQKHDAAPSFFAENPYWPHFHHLAAYTARLSYAMSCGREQARVALLYPTQTLWGGGETAKVARRAFEELQNELFTGHIGFHPMDAQTIQNARAQKDALHIGRAHYQALVVPPHVSSDPELEAALATAKDAGLAIIDTSSEIWREQLIPFQKLHIRDENGEEINEIYALWRETDEAELLFLCNTSASPQTAHVTIEANVQSWENWSLESGDSVPYAATIEGALSTLAINLPAFGSILLVGSHRPQPAITSEPQPTASPIPLDGQWELRLQEPNALRLNRWRVACLEGDWSSPIVEDGSWSQTEALPLAYLDQTRKVWVRACERHQGVPVWYRRRLQSEIVPPDLEVLIENGAILGDWTLFINGVEVEKSAFAPRDLHGWDKIAASIAHLWRRGENVLALRIENAPEGGGLRTPIHLLGSFALGGSSKRVLLALPQNVAFSDLVASGLPHFSGTATYRKYMQASDLGGASHLTLPADFGDVAEVRINGISLGVRPWSPYRWELISPLTGTIELEIAVTNTLLPFVEGQIWDKEVNGAQRV